MKLLKPTFFLIAFLSFFSLQSFSQTQSLWSEIRKPKADSVGLNAQQYQVPLVGERIDYFDVNKMLGKNLWVDDNCTYIVRDFNKDGFADIFLAFNSSEKESVPFMILFYNKNNGRYEDQSSRLRNNTGQPTTRKGLSADFNGDGLLDIVAVSHPECDTCRMSYFDVILSNPDTTWIQKTLKISNARKCEGYNHGVAIGDIDNDGDIDVVLANEIDCNNGSICYINDGKGNFKPNPVSTINRGQDFVTNAWTNELVDINNDGCLDLLYWHDEKNTRILYGNCKTSFDNSYQDLGPLKYTYIMDYDVRDMNGDGDFDLILTTTDYNTGWQIVFLENKGKDNTGKVIWADKTDLITQSLKIQGFYPDGYFGLPYIQVVDINADGILDIIPQTPLSNTESVNGQLQHGQWILLGEDAWRFKYNRLPFAEAPKQIISEFNSNKVSLKWERVKQSYSTSDGGINKWAIYVSDKNWGDRSQVSTPIIVSASDTKSENGLDQYSLFPTSKEMFIRISPIDSTGIEWPLSKIHKITINAPTISSATICDGQTLTLIGTNFVGVQSIKVGNSDVISFDVLSESTLQAKLNNGQVGNVNLASVGGNAVYSNLTYFSSPLDPFVITGKKKLINSSTEIFHVTNFEGINYIWSFPDGWQVISGGSTNSVTVKVGHASGEVKVYPSAICGNLKPISLPVTVYTYIPDDNFQKALRELGIDKENKPDSILTSSIASIKELSLDSMDIADLTGIQDFTDLRILKCRSNKLKNLNITNNELLSELFCGYNNLTSIDLSKNIALKILSCEWNQIKNLDVTKNTELNALGCDGIPITTLNVNYNKELTLLSISAQDIKSIDISNNTKLTYFSCVDLKLTELDVSKNINLGLFNCSGNQLTSIDVSKNVELTYFGCANNKLVYLNMKNGRNEILKTFYADNNPNLTCICVDNPTLAVTYSDWKKDVTAKYSDYCIPTGIELPELNQSILVIPNPSSSIFKIEGLPINKKNQIAIYSIDGRLIRKQISNSLTENIDLSNQSSGVYVLFINGQPFKLLKD